MKVGNEIVNSLTPVRTGRAPHRPTRGESAPKRVGVGSTRPPRSLPKGAGQTPANAIVATPDNITAAEKFYHRYLDSYQVTLTYRFDRDSGDLLAKILERYGREEIRQFPPEHVVAFAARFNDWLGLILDMQA